MELLLKTMNLRWIYDEFTMNLRWIYAAVPERFHTWEPSLVRGSDVNVQNGRGGRWLHLRAMRWPNPAAVRCDLHCFTNVSRLFCDCLSTVCFAADCSYDYCWWTGKRWAVIFGNIFSAGAWSLIGAILYSKRWIFYYKSWTLYSKLMTRIGTAASTTQVLAGTVMMYPFGVYLRPSVRLNE